MTTARLFAAVWPPREVVSTLEAMARPAVAGVRWTTPHQWHVTLAFFGNVEEQAVEEMGAGLVRGLAGAAAPEVRLGPATSRLGRSVLCVRADGLDRLAAAVCETPGLVPVGDGAGNFRGHLTLARASGGRCVPTPLCGVELAATWRAEQVCLVRSQLAPGGARYSIVATAVVSCMEAGAGLDIPHRTDVRR